MAKTMTKLELLNSLPGIINHKSYGYAELEVVTDKKNEKGICYRHKDNTASGAAFGKDWFEVYENCLQNLKIQGYVKTQSKF